MGCPPISGIRDARKEGRKVIEIPNTKIHEHKGRGILKDPCLIYLYRSSKIGPIKGIDKKCFFYVIEGT